MSAIGPGDWVECLKSASGYLTVGAIYQVQETYRPRGCFICGPDNPGGLRLVGHPREIVAAGRSFRLCMCGFRLWPPPADEALRNEEAPQDAREPVAMDLGAVGQEAIA